MPAKFRAIFFHTGLTGGSADRLKRNLVFVLPPSLSSLAAHFPKFLFAHLVAHAPVFAAVSLILAPGRASGENRFDVRRGFRFDDPVPDFPAAARIGRRSLPLLLGLRGFGRRLVLNFFRRRPIRFGDGSEADGYRPRHGADGGLGAAVSQAGDFMRNGGVDEEAPRGTIYSSAAAQEYTTRVDADGDGRWDEFTATNRGDGGVDLSVDRDGDGQAEFVGHDLDRDGLIDEATIDEDGDGTLDTRWVDTDGDGWLDARQQPPAYEAQRSEVRDPRAQ